MPWSQTTEAQAVADRVLLYQRQSGGWPMDLDVEVVVAERVVLRRVEDLEQRRGRVSPPVGAQLVDLVQHDHRVHRAGVAERPHEAPGSAPM